MRTFMLIVGVHDEQKVVLLKVVDPYAKTVGVNKKGRWRTVDVPLFASSEHEVKDQAKVEDWRICLLQPSYVLNCKEGWVGHLDLLDTMEVVLRKRTTTCIIELANLEFIHLLVAIMDGHFSVNWI